MKWTLPVVAAMLLSGCGAENALPPSSSAANDAKAIGSAAAEPAGGSKTVAPLRHSETTEENGTVNGAMLFAQKCAACHGQNAQKQALGQSQVIAGWESERVVNALNGYIEGSYGKSMSAMMQAQVKSLSPKQIKALAGHISGL